MKAFVKKHRGFMARLVDVCVGFIIGFFFAIDVVLARNIDPSKAGVTLWIFLAVGAMVVLLQLIPAFILFTTFISSGMYKIIKSKKEEEHNEEKVEQEA